MASSPPLVMLLRFPQVNLPRVKTIVYWGQPSGLALQALQVGAALLRSPPHWPVAGCWEMEVQTSARLWLQPGWQAVPARALPTCLPWDGTCHQHMCAPRHPLALRDRAPFFPLHPLQTIQGLSSLSGVYSFQDFAALGREHPAPPGKLRAGCHTAAQRVLVGCPYAMGICTCTAWYRHAQLIALSGY